MMDRVRSGQKISARPINQALEGMDLQPDILSGKGLSKGQTAFYAQAENISAQLLEPFSAVIIKGQSLTSNPQGQRDVVLQVDIPTVGDDLNRFAVVEDFIPAGKIGRVCILGVCWVETDLSEGEFASPAEGQTTFSLSDSGPAEVLSGSGDQYALLRFPVGTSGEIIQATELVCVGFTVSGP